MPRLGDRIDVETLVEAPKRRCAALAGYSLHADVAVPAFDRERLERLCRYVMRPPLATERLTEHPDGRLAYALRRPWRDGTKGFLFSPAELLEKLVALVPPPRGNTVRYHGVLAANARGRSEVVGASRTCRKSSGAAARRPGQEPAEVAAGPAGHPGGDRRPEVPQPHDSGLEPLRPRRLSWSQLMARVFRKDVMECVRCHGRMRVIAALVQADVIAQVLRCLGLPTEPPRAARARPPPQADLAFPQPTWDP